MNYVGIDVHKRYSVCAAQDEQGRELGVVRIEGNSGSGLAQFLHRLGGISSVALEACWNWGKAFDLLEALPQVAEIAVAHPLKTRLIGESQIKTDTIYAQALATLLRGGFTPKVHVPAKAVRQRKDQLRQRLHWFACAPEFVIGCMPCSTDREVSCPDRPAGLDARARPLAPQRGDAWFRTRHEPVSAGRLLLCLFPRYVR